MIWQKMDMAARLWNAGRTSAEIAWKVGERESVVANQIEAIRDKARRIRLGDFRAGGPRPPEVGWGD